MISRRARWIARRRAEARAEGLCITCFKVHPGEGRSVCRLCTESAHSRTIRRRLKLRQRADSQQVVRTHEHAGDVAREHYLHTDAAQHYQDALKAPAINSEEHVRISEKLAYTLSLGEDPNAANPWFDQALASYADKTEKTSKTIEILLQRARQLWIDARADSALPLLHQAVHIAEINGETRLRKLALSRMANYVLGLGRYDEARLLLNSVGEVDNRDDPSIRAAFYMQSGILTAVRGNAAEAFDYFERAIDAAKEDPDVFHVTNTWTAYGLWSAVFGEVERAKSCHERALLVARQHRISWRIPSLCLQYANLLAGIGQHGLAHEYVMNALAYDVQAPTTDVLLAEVGIPIALHMKDETMLATCARSSSIDFAFRSGQPVTIGNVVGAFAQWYTISNRGQEARVLLHRALEIICNVGYCVQIWILPISIARFGFRKDIPAARHLIEKRTILPCADVAHACLDLFDAFVEQRQGQQSEMQRHAINAIRRFGTLGWHGYAELARTLVPAHMQIRTTVVSGSKPFSDLPHVLTSRELQVAELVLKGLTNREIAKILSIKERTVEAHMTSIMGHLGIRSRHQLVDHFVPG